MRQAMKRILLLAMAAGAGLFFSTQVAEAQIVSYSFQAKVVGGDWDGETGLGVFSYDMSLVPTSGDWFLFPTDVTMVLNLFGQSFTEQDDSAYPGAPVLGFSDGQPTLISWWIEEPPTTIDEPGVTGIYIDGLLLPPPGGTTSYDYTVQTTVLGTAPIPEPSSVAFAAVMGLGLGAFVIRRRRGKKA